MLSLMASGMKWALSHYPYLYSLLKKKNSFAMAVFYTQGLQELLKMTVGDVHQIYKTFKPSSCKPEKGFRLHASSLEVEK